MISPRLANSAVLAAEPKNVNFASLKLALIFAMAALLITPSPSHVGSSMNILTNYL